MRKLALVVVAAVLVAGCGGADPSPEAASVQVSTTTVAPTITAPDPGVTACKTIARRAAAKKAPTDLQRAAGWRDLQASQHEDLQNAGAKLQKAWTEGDLADQVEANVNAAMACAVHGVEVKVG